MNIKTTFVIAFLISFGFLPLLADASHRTSGSGMTTGATAVPEAAPMKAWTSWHCAAHI